MALDVSQRYLASRSNGRLYARELRICRISSVCRRLSSHVLVVFLGDEALRRLPEMRCGHHQLGS